MGAPPGGSRGLLAVPRQVEARGRGDRRPEGGNRRLGVEVDGEASGMGRMIARSLWVDSRLMPMRALYANCFKAKGPLNASRIFTI